MSEDVDQSGGMDIDQMGPVDYLVVEFPGNKMTGEGLPLLVDLVDRGIIRILDFAFVMKELDGSVHAIAISDFDGDGQLDLAVFEGASSGLLDEGDLDEAGGVLEPGSSAGVLVYENVWAAPFAPRAAARRRSAGRERSDPDPGAVGGRGRTRCRGLRGLRHEREAENDARTYSRSGPHRRRSPVRRPRCPTGSRGARPAAGRSRSSSSTRSSAGPGSTRLRRRRRLRRGSDMDAKLAQLKELGELKDQGILSDAEFEVQKDRILNS